MLNKISHFALTLLSNSKKVLFFELCALLKITELQVLLHWLSGRQSKFKSLVACNSIAT